MPPRIVVVGSVNLDLVVRVARLPEPGETVGGGTFARVPGGKGANQAVACARLGAEVTMVGAVGRDPFADEALAGLRKAGVTLGLEASDEPTGVAVIQVDDEGETTISVASGANAMVAVAALPPHDAVLCQLEVPDEAVLAAWEACTGLFCLNAAPARPIALDADLTVVNRLELETLVRRDGLVALTLGSEGAVLLDDGEELARATPPAVDAVDGTSRAVRRTWRCAAPARRGRSRRRASAPSRRFPPLTRSTRSSLGDNRRDGDADHPRLRPRPRRRDRAAARAG
jgi:ribokinase